MRRLRNIAMHDYQESVTTGQTQTDRQTDGCRTKLSLCAAMLRRRHKNTVIHPQNFVNFSVAALGILLNNIKLSTYFNTYNYYRISFLQ